MLNCLEEKNYMSLIFCFWKMEKIGFFNLCVRHTILFSLTLKSVKICREIKLNKLIFNVCYLLWLWMLLYKPEQIRNVNANFKYCILILHEWSNKLYICKMYVPMCIGLCVCVFEHKHKQNTLFLSIYYLFILCFFFLKL